ncbi:MAG: hypothetical protein JWM07_548 [Candidatus Saccharibacteria bacterium]|jgi:hypothetical protein|nr:hypothetical protein [Candidatus Saccharibacteria bacterium]
MSYILFFLFGIFAANGMPHFVKGMTGEKHMTPFGKPSSAQVNVIWGIVNFYIAFWLITWAVGYEYNLLPASLSVAGGMLAIGSVCTKLWSDDDQARGREIR